jgi:hypothetical protein
MIPYIKSCNKIYESVILYARFWIYKIHISFNLYTIRFLLKHEFPIELKNNTRL